MSHSWSWLFIVLICISAVAFACRSGEFACARGRCVPLIWRCDGENDCDDNSDEINCDECRGDMFLCGNKRCIPRNQLCNGNKDCKDGSDESSCEPVIRKDCKNETEFDCGNKTCIPVELLCNHQNDCGLWQDEPLDKCDINECLLNNGGCSDLCVDLPIGFRCTCPAGYQLNDSTCIDIDECKIPGFCSQLCNNSMGSYACACLEGYRVDPSNNTRCIPEAGLGAIFFMNHTSLLKLDLETYQDETIVSRQETPVALDYDFEKQIILWSDISSEGIYRLSLGNGSSQSAPKIESVLKDERIRAEGIAMDWIHDNFYFTDTWEKTINVASLDGKRIKVLFRNDLDKPRGIVVNPLEGWLFWTDWGRRPKLERAGMDGTHRSVIVSENIGYINYVAIDLETRKLFWDDSRLDKLCSSDYDGSNVKVLISSVEESKHPFAVDVFGDWLYWNDWRSRSIHRINKFSGGDLQTIASNIYLPTGMKVYHSYKQPKGVNYCGYTNGGCSHFCLPAPQITEESAKFSCACPDGMVLADNKKTCVAAEK